MTTPKSDSSPRRIKVSAVLFFCALTTLIAGLWWTVATRRTLAGQIDVQRQKLIDLQKTANRRKHDRQQSDRDRNVVAKVLRHCRSADDIPVFGGSRLISHLVNGQSLAFYVPDGSHTLKIHTAWESTPSTQPTTEKGDDVDAEAAGDAENAITGEGKLTGEKTWTVPLIAEHGYFLTTSDDHSSENPVEWELTSNAPTFRSRTEKVPTPPLRLTGASWSHDDLMEFPNQVTINSIVRKTTKPELLKPQRVGRWTRSGRIEQQHVKITFTVTVESDSPPVISASVAEMIVRLRRTELIGDYLGDGCYEAVLP